MFGYSGADTLYGNSGNDYLNGGKHNDTLFGGIGNDLLNGENGDDILNGGDNDDVLTGGIGNDQLTGGSGNDDFQIVTGFGRDLITDYSAGEDSLKISGSYAQDDFTFTYSNGHTNIHLGNDLLAIVQNSILTGADLIII